MRTSIAFLLALGLPLWTVPTGQTPEDRLATSTPLAHVRFLASDELRGRKAGTAEADIAARYLAEQLRAAGVERVPGAPDYFQEVSWEREGVTSRSRNVVGVIAGREPRRAREHVLLVAHYDGLGTENAEGREVIFNGARDNALGTAALLAAAEALAAQPPARSILVLAVTAEEEPPFMIGSRFFVDHPPVPLNTIVFVLNNDGAGAYEEGIWSIGGLERTTAEPLVRSAGLPFELATEPYPPPFRPLYEKGDSISFARKGIPALTISPGFRRVDERVRKYVHSPADRVDETLDPGYLLRFCQAYARLARLIADAETVPSWRVGDPLGASLSSHCRKGGARRGRHHAVVPPSS